MCNRYPECMPLLTSVRDGARTLDLPPQSRGRYHFAMETTSNCGGFDRQWFQNQGRCGPCGDPWDIAVPRPHETRGRYGRGIIVANYTQAQCKSSDDWNSLSEEIVNANLIHSLKDTRSVSLSANMEPTSRRGVMSIGLFPNEEGVTELNVNLTGTLGQVTHFLTLPREVTCGACVIQWRYVTDQGRSRSEYRACADVTVLGYDNVFQNNQVTNYPSAASENFQRRSFVPVSTMMSLNRSHTPIGRRTLVTLTPHEKIPNEMNARGAAMTMSLTPGLLLTLIILDSFI
ncbi:hypothetical protein SK128_023795 [Halocaridina rubra]|uniref:Chitin-binding type-4 domain-containing protein n=1 Tax=Halocaridina rubra TaxID=373956 RepID=A0AAN8X988_HALRR